VVARDLASRYFRDGLMNPWVAQAYWEYVLSPGSLRPAKQKVEAFLGRAQGMDAYLAWLSGRP
jgi:Zn-dependent oligopeptidase